MRLPDTRGRVAIAVCSGALLAGLGACWSWPTGPNDAGFPCIICLATTDLRLEGVAPVAVGDTLRLRVLADQQNILFQYRLAPVKVVSWTIAYADSGQASLRELRATSDTATWGRALLIGRAPGTVRVEAREGNFATNRLITVLPAPSASEARREITGDPGM